MARGGMVFITLAADAEQTNKLQKQLEKVIDVVEVKQAGKAGQDHFDFPIKMIDVSSPPQRKTVRDQSFECDVDFIPAY
jgi:acetolactate synthase small subunit